MNNLKHWSVPLVLGLVCNGLGILLHRQGEERIAIALVILGIINVLISGLLHHHATKSTD